MFHPHSLLWHYLWVGPYVLLAALASLMRSRGLHKRYPAFFCYAIFEAVGGSAIYILDITPSFSDATYWRGSFVFLVIEVLVKFAVVGEVFTELLRRYRPLSKLARVLVSGIGVLLILTGTIIAAYASSTNFWLISATRILGRSVSIAQCGLIIFLFIFAAYFHLTWDRPVFGITLGFGLVASFNLSYWALTAGWLLGPKSYLLDFLVMATYHLCVLIWCLLPARSPQGDHDLCGFIAGKQSGDLEPGIGALVAMNLAVVLVVAAAVALGIILRLAVTQSLEVRKSSALAGTIRPIDVEAFRNLANPAQDEYLRLRLPPAEFRVVRRERLRAMAAYIQVTGANAAILVRIGEAALATRDARIAGAAQQLVNDALLLRRNTSVALVRIYIALAWPNSGFAAARVADRYEQVSGSAMLLGRLQNPAVAVRL